MYNTVKLRLPYGIVYDQKIVFIMDYLLWSLASHIYTWTSANEDNSNPEDLRLK